MEIVSKNADIFGKFYLVVLCSRLHDDRISLYIFFQNKESFFITALPAHSGPRPLTQFRNHFSQMVGLLGRVMSSSQGIYLNTGQHKHGINAYTPNIHALSGIRTNDPSVRASEDSSCLRPRGRIRKADS
jgi:hypothetical protein